MKQILTELQKFHSEIDEKVLRLEKIHSERINCKAGCASCCVDELTVFEVEAENIKQNYSELLSTAAPAEKGKCAFLDEEDKCRVYNHRPYVCRTQGLPLSWIEELEDGSFAEMRDICPLNDESSPIENIDSEECWVIGPAEQKLFELECSFNDDSYKRIYLRDLFSKK